VPASPPPPPPPRRRRQPCVPSLRGEWGEVPRCARKPPSPPPRVASPPPPGAPRSVWFEGERAVASLTYLTRVAWGEPPPTRPRPSPAPFPQLAEEADWRPAAAAAAPEPPPVAPIPSSVTAEAKRARVVSHRTLVGALATGLAVGEVGTTYDATLAPHAVPAVAVHSTPRGAGAEG
jgi:hypothetical protein